MAELIGHVWLHEFDTRNKRRKPHVGDTYMVLVCAASWLFLQPRVARVAATWFSTRSFLSSFILSATRGRHLTLSHARYLKPRVVQQKKEQPRVVILATRGEAAVRSGSSAPRTKMPRRNQSHAWSLDHTWPNVAKIAYQLTISHAWYITYELNPRVGHAWANA